MFKTLLFILISLFFINGCSTNNKIQKMDTAKIKMQKNNPRYLEYFDKNEEKYYVNVEGISNPIQLIQHTGIPYVKNIEILSDTIMLLHATAGGQGTYKIVDYNYTYILDKRKKSIVGFLQYNEEDSLLNSTPVWKIKDDEVIASYYEQEYKQTKFKLSKILDINDANIEFKNIINRFKHIVKKQNIFGIYPNIGIEFKIENDYEGVFNKEDLPSHNFMKILPLDSRNNKTKAQAWIRLSHFFNSNIYLKEEDEYCLLRGMFYNDINKDAKLCLKKVKNKYWRIVRYVHVYDE